MVKNGICLGGASNQNALFFLEKCAPKNASMPSLSRIGPANAAQALKVNLIVF